MTQSPVAHEGMPLAEGFGPRTHEEWQNLVAGVLNKRRPEGEHLDGPQAEAALRTVLEGGLTIDPLYLRRDRPLGIPGAMPFTRGRVLRDAATAWDVRQLHDDPDAARSRAAVLDDLEHGVTSAWVHVGADGVAVGDLAEALADVRFDLAPVVVSSWTEQPGAARALLELVPDGRTAGGNLGLDPVGAAARTGAVPDLAPLADLVRAAAAHEGWRAVTVDARVLHDAGASVVDALAVAVATGVEYLRHLEGEGVAPADAFEHVELRVPATQDQFLTAASLRAVRRVWARVGEACGVPEEQRGARTHAVTSLRMMTREDPWVNVLRSTLAVFGASAGGADAITVLPHDTVGGLPSPFSRRLARNTQVVLADEANIGRVTDPGGGSWYLESLTDDVARNVWARFREVEAAGGAVGGRRHRGEARRHRHPPPPDHRRLDVPDPHRPRPRPAAPDRATRRRRRVRAPARRRRVRGVARPGPTPRRAGRGRAGPRAAARARPAADVRHQPPRGGRHRTGRAGRPGRHPRVEREGLRRPRGRGHRRAARGGGRAGARRRTPERARRRRGPGRRRGP
jgi:methylmalonyl-CoA mutase